MDHLLSKEYHGPPSLCLQSYEGECTPSFKVAPQYHLVRGQEPYGSWVYCNKTGLVSNHIWSTFYPDLFPHLSLEALITFCLFWFLDKGRGRVWARKGLVDCPSTMSLIAT